jgi:hypothetical protein
VREAQFEDWDMNHPERRSKVARRDHPSDRMPHVAHDPVPRRLAGAALVLERQE